jgi:hypothetical protein
MRSPGESALPGVAARLYAQERSPTPQDEAGQVLSELRTQKRIRFIEDLDVLHNLAMKLPVSMSLRWRVAGEALVAVPGVKSIHSWRDADGDNFVIRQRQNRNVPLLQLFQTPAWGSSVV